jgi:hypothetical protein
VITDYGFRPDPIESSIDPLTELLVNNSYLSPGMARRIVLRWLAEEDTEEE